MVIVGLGKELIKENEEVVDIKFLLKDKYDLNNLVSGKKKRGAI